MKKFDIIIVGAGILGIAHAYHCLQAGFKVAIIEKNHFPEGASVRNFGQIVPSGFGSKWQEFGRQSLRIYNDIQSQYDITVKPGGSIYLANNKEEMTLLEELADINKQNGYHSELLTDTQCREKFPMINKTYVKSGLYFPQEITVDPRNAALKLLKFLQLKYGLIYFSGKPVKNILRVNQEVILTISDQTSIKAEKVFVCSGNDFQILYPDVFLQSDLELVKLQMMDTQPNHNTKLNGSILTGWTIRRYESFSECNSWDSIKSKENLSDFHQLNGIHILFKQSDDGSVIIGDSHHYSKVAEKLEPDFDTSNEINCYMLTQAQRILNLDDWKIRNTWLGFYSQCTQQDIFNYTIDEHVHIITGIGGKGMTASFGYAKENIKNILALNQLKI